MTSDDPSPQALPIDDVYVYVDDDREDMRGEPVEEQVRFKRNRSAQDHLAIVRIEDSEIDRLRSQIKRIVLRLEPSKEDPDDTHFSVDSVTAHVGLSASGHFFFVASASVEAALDITWRRG